MLVNHTPHMPGRRVGYTLNCPSLSLQTRIILQIEDNRYDDDQDEGKDLPATQPTKGRDFTKRWQFKIII